jgi:hypothetical protein
VSVYRCAGAERAEHSVRTRCHGLDAGRAVYYAWRHGATHMGQTDRELVVHLRTAHRESRGHLRQSSADRRPPATGATAGSPACCSFLAGGLAGKTIEHRCHQGRESTGGGEQGLCRHLASADHTHMIGRILSKFPAQFDYSTVSRMALAMESLCKLSVASLLLPACCAGRLCR